MNEQVGLGEWNEKSMKKYGQDVVAVPNQMSSVLAALSCRRRDIHHDCRSVMQLVSHRQPTASSCGEMLM